MKKIILPLLALMGISTSAQPIMTATDFSTDYFAATYDATATGLTPGNAGPNQIWDFSGIASTLSATFGTLPIANTPLATTFPTSNYCWKYLYTPGQDSSHLALKVSSTTLEIVGFDYTATGLATETNTYPNTQILFQFPYTYNTVIIDTYQDSAVANTKSFTSTYDAYGTIKTPFGTFTNVLRQKKVEGTDISYTWFTVNPFSIVMDGSFGTNSYLTFYKNTTGLGINESQLEKSISIYPNPTKNLINFQVPNNETVDKIIITDLTGKIVLTQIENTTQVNVAPLSNGLYLLQAFSGNEKFQTKFIKE